MAIGAAFKLAMKGVGKAIKAVRAARAARAADEVIPMFSKGESVAAHARPAALNDVLNDIKKAGVEVRANQEAEDYLNFAARQQGMDPSKMHACTLGDDLIMVRAEHVDNPRILREELIHTQQAKDGLISSASVVDNEIAARQQMIENAEVGHHPKGGRGDAARHRAHTNDRHLLTRRQNVLRQSPMKVVMAALAADRGKQPDGTCPVAARLKVIAARIGRDRDLREWLHNRSFQLRTATRKKRRLSARSSAHCAHRIAAGLVVAASVCISRAQPAG
jgi:hypothetical protein